MTKAADLSNLTEDEAAVLDVELQRQSCVYFAQRNLSGRVRPDKPDLAAFNVGPHHLEWNSIVEEKRALILAPRDHGKSFFYSMAFPIWRASHHAQRGDQLYLFSSNQERSNELLQIVADELQNNPKLRWLVPTRSNLKWSKKKIITTTGLEIRARGWGVKVRGGHPRWIVCDDVLGDQTLWSEIQRKKDADYFFTAITPMVVPGGQILVPGTPFHGDDLYAQIQKLGAYVVWKKPALNKQGRALWPARHNAASLRARRDEIGSVRFTREYGVEPISDDMSLFPSYLFEGEPIRQRAVKLGASAAYWEAMGIRTRFFGVDIALSAETGADYFVIVCIGVDDAGNRWLCDLFYAKGLSFHAQLDAIHAMAKRLDPALIYIEDNAMQRVWGDELIRTSDLPIKKFTTTAQIKNSLEKGIFVLRPLFENKKHRLPVGDAESVEKVQWLISQFVQFAWVDGKLQGVGSHDDGVIAYWIANFAASRGGSAFASFGAVNTRTPAKALSSSDNTAVASKPAGPDTGPAVPGPRLSGAFGGGFGGPAADERHRMQQEKNARK